MRYLSSAQVAGGKKGSRAGHTGRLGKSWQGSVLREKARESCKEGAGRQTVGDEQRF